MKKIQVYIVLLALLMGCSSLKTSYDYDKQTDFTKYKTYGYTEEALKLPIQEINRNRLIAAIDREMTARGLSKSENPDVLIDLIGKTQQKRDATATTTGTGYYSPWRYSYGVGFTTTQINVNEYVEGTLFINMVDKQSDKLVWQGRGTKVLNEKANPDKREKNINDAVAAIFKHYPKRL